MAVYVNVFKLNDITVTIDNNNPACGDAGAMWWNRRTWGDKPGNVPNSQSIDGTPISNIYFNIYHKSDLL